GTQARPEKTSLSPPAGSVLAAQVPCDPANPQSRDNKFVVAVDRHRGLTADQLAEIFFDSQSALVLDLHRFGVLDCFQPHRPPGAATPTTMSWPQSRGDPRPPR